MRRVRKLSAQATVGVFSGEALQRYQRDFAAIDPAPPAFITRPAGTAIPTDRLLAEEKRRPGVFFSEFFRPLGLEECLGGTLASTNGRFAMVGLHRSPDRKPFDDDDIARLEGLMRPPRARAATSPLLHRTGARGRRAVGGVRPAGGRRS